MPRVHTHYDNLKVSRDAPIEVIRAAYRSLSAKYQPDLHPGDEAARIMRLINAAYEVLSDPGRKLEHDRWIASIESDSVKFAPPEIPRRPRSAAPQDRAQSIESITEASTASPWIRVVAGVSLGLVLLVALFSGRATFTAPTPAAAGSTQPVQLQLRYSRPALAPNGQPWPLNSGYLTKNALASTGGLSSVTIDNEENSSDKLVKLKRFERRTELPATVRVFFLRAHDQFTLTNIKAGSYDIRCQDLDSGIMSRSEPFDLYESRESGGTRYSTMTLTLYTVPDGNTRFETIGPDEF